MLQAVLLSWLLLGVTTSHQLPSQQSEVTQDQIWARLLRYFETTVNSSATQIAKRLDTIEAGIAERQEVMDREFRTISNRLDSMQAALAEEQNDTQQDVAALSDRLDAIQQSLAGPCPAHGRLLGKACRADADCRELVTDSVCNASGVCACTDGFQEVADGTCRPFPRLSEQCQRDAECREATRHAVCNERVCSCPTGFWNRDNAECRPGVTEGESCLYDGDCSVHRANFTCTNGECALRKCGIVSVLKTSNNVMWSYRLAGGTSCDNGLVLARKDGKSGKEWTSFVCDEDWTAEDAQVLCRSLGFASGTPKKPSWHDKQVKRYWLTRDYSCVGTEKSLMACQYVGVNERKRSGGCPINELAAVTCY